MEELFDVCIEFAKHVDPISTTTLLRSDHTNKKSTGLFDAVDPAAHNMTAFKTAFLRADKDRRLNTPSTRAARYHHAAVVITPPVVTRTSIDL
jgi:hypothetical protein